MKYIDTMLSVFQRHSCICQVIIWTPEGPISYASESLIVIFLPWYNCCVYVLNGNKMFLNWNWKWNGICKRSDTLWPAGRVRLFADYTISLSSSYRLIWRHWTNRIFVRYMLPSVCLRLKLFSQLSFIQYMGLCVFSLPNSQLMIVRMCTLSYYHHQIGSMNH